MSVFAKLVLPVAAGALLAGCGAFQPSRCAPTPGSCVEVSMTAEEAADVDRMEREAKTPKPGELGVKITEICVYWDRQLATVDPARSGAAAYIARRRDHECKQIPADSPCAAGGDRVVDLDVPQRLLGEWVMAPPPHERRAAELVRHALHTPPDREAFEAMSPTERERRNFDNVLRLRDEEPGSPLLAQLRRKMDGLDAVRVIFTEDEMITTTPNGTDSSGYVIEEDLGDRIVLLENGDPTKRRIIAFDGDDAIVVTVGPTRVPMNRVPAGSAPSPTSAPTSAHAPTIAPTQPPTTADPFGACVAEYYRCIDEMPARAREQSASVIEATKGVFGRARRSSPSDREATLRSCRRAVDLAKLTFCPAR